MQPKQPSSLLRFPQTEVTGRQMNEAPWRTNSLATFPPVLPPGSMSGKVDVLFQSVVCKVHKLSVKEFVLKVFNTYRSLRVLS